MKGTISLGLLIAALASPLFPAAWTDRGEYDLVLTIRAEATAQTQVTLLDQWKAKYPQSPLRQIRRELYLSAYQSMGDSERMLATAREMLTDQPDNPLGAYWCAVLLPGAKDASPDLWNTGEKAARQLLTGAPESGEWQKQKGSVELLARRALAWIQWQRGDYGAAETEFTAYLQKDPANAEISAWYGMALAAQKKPEKVVPALWQLARAGSLNGPGALPEVSKRQTAALAERVYISYHGDTEGLEQLRAAAVAGALPPADFRVESADAVAARKADEELKRTNPQLALWMTMRKQLEGPAGEKYFAETLQPAPLPKLKGTVIRCTPEAKPAEIVLGLSNGVTDEVLLKLSAPLTSGAAPGTEIEFEGSAEAYSRDPFRLTVATDKTKITGWPEKPTGKR